MAIRLSKERRKQIGEAQKKLWGDPAYKARMIEIQKRSGLRNYGTHISGKLIMK